MQFINKLFQIVRFRVYRAQKKMLEIIQPCASLHDMPFKKYSLCDISIYV